MRSWQALLLLGMSCYLLGVVTAPVLVWWLVRTFGASHDDATR